MPRLLVTVRDPEETTGAVRDSGVDVLATYPDALLVSASDEQADDLAARGVEAVALPDPPVRVSGTEFAFDAALRAEEAAPVEPPPGRTAYYLVRLAGPPAPPWLAVVRGLGAVVHSTLAGSTLLVGALPERVAALRAQPWVLDVTPFRPAMKVAATLRRGRERALDARALSEVDAADLAEPDRQLVEVSVFPGESTAELAALVRREGGTVLSTRPTSLVVNASADALARVAQVQGVQALLPHALPEPHNDRATAVMGIPADRVLGGTALTGAGQLVAVADSGLDTGDATTVHDDFRGRVAGITSWPAGTDLALFVHDAPGSDDGPADANSGHGTHVAGSVLGDGATAAAAGVKPGPVGAAPEAELFFQAVEQRLRWKSAAELAAEGLDVPLQPWPPAASGLYGLPERLGALFEQAYAAGARIHTNSWGAPVAGVYNANAREVDEFCFAHPDMLVLFSAGNSGVDADGDGVIDTDSLGSPATAKNCLTVGASENDRPAGSTPKPGRDRLWHQVGDPPRWPTLQAAGHVSDDVDGMAPFSSRGPADDGRIKPDVVAPGTNVLSTLSRALPATAVPLWGRLAPGDPLRDGYCWSGGTSMSTPLVAGAAALVRQYLVDRRGHLAPGRQPSAALLKAVLVGGAVAMPGQFAGEVPAGPNPVTGFGRVHAGAAVAPGGMRPLFADAPHHAVTTGEMRTYLLRDVDPGRTLTVTLVWTDAPAPAGVGGLENALYLQLVDPSGRVLDGDVTPFPTATNNVQRIVVDAPDAGDWTVRVRGISVTRHSPGAAPSALPRQDFAVVASNGVDLLG
jgi:serine protease AprX